jgi:predicted TIM-barrel fold metal-dependent hydrolase
MTRTLVDIHPHVISPDDSKYPKVPLGGVRSKWSQERPVDWEQLSAAMDAAGVTKAAVVQSSTTYGHDNSYLADCVDRAGGKITGVCSVGFMDDDAIQQMDYWIGERGMSGVRLFTTGSTMGQSTWLDDAKTKPAWAYVAERGIPVCVQISGSALPQLENILKEFPGLCAILDHIAMTPFTDGPPYTAADPVYSLARFEGLNLKMTSRTLLGAKASSGGSPGMLRDLISHFGSDRIAWGSNYPANEGTLSSLVSLLEEAVAGLSEADAANVYSGTALKLYPKLAEPQP